VPGFTAEQLQKELPELPEVTRARYREEGLRAEYVEIFLADERYRKLYEAVSGEVRALAANYIASDIAGLVGKYGEAGLARTTPSALGALLARVRSGELSSRGVKDILTEVFVSGGDLADISQKYTQQNNADELGTVVEKIIAAHTDAVADYKKGKTAALQFLVGQAMKATKGGANPKTLRALFETKIRL